MWKATKYYYINLKIIIRIINNRNTKNQIQRSFLKIILLKKSIRFKQDFRSKR